MQRYTKSTKYDTFLAIIQLSVKSTQILTIRKLLIYNDLRKSYKNALKKITKKDTSY